MREVQLYDTTLRDGMQGQGMSLSAQEKVRVVRKLDDLGIRFVEAGFPGSNPKERELFETLAEVELRQLRAKVRALAAASDTQRNPALSTLAISHVFEGNGAAAAKFYQQVFDSQLKANAISPAANTANALARTLLETGDLDNAAKWYRTGHETAAKIQNVPPEETDIWEMRWRHAQGRIAARRKQFDAARDHLAAVEGLVAKGTLPDGQQSFAPQLAGYIAFYQGNHDEAIAALAKADQQDPFVLGLLAQAHEQKKDMATAKELYARVLARPGFSLQMALARPLAARR